jgi:mono/diheme cytochrome c family protein
MKSLPIKRLSMLSMLVLIAGCQAPESGSALKNLKSRAEKSMEAEAYFRQATFYKDGRGMILPTGVLQVGESKVWGLARPILDKAGLLTEENSLVGGFARSYKQASVIAMGCVACHAGKAAGKIYVGLGNKNIDVGWAGKLGRPMIQLLQQSDRFFPVPGVAETTQVASAFFELLSRPGRGNHTQGLVPTSVIAEWFFRVQGEPMDLRYKSGQVKVPAWWGYGEKRAVGQFADGFGLGSPPGWGLAVELTAGQTPENIRSMIHDVEIAEQRIGDLLPPEYPFPIDAQKAAAGELLFADNCSRCHGSYGRDLEGFPIFTVPKFVPIEIVKTDPNRTGNIDEALIEAIAISPLKDILQTTDLRAGYFAPRLHAVWARFPYLHNASVPNLKSLLMPAKERPRLFSLLDAGEDYRYDRAAIGLTVPDPGSHQERLLLQAAKRGERWLYDTERGETSSEGHSFGTRLEPSEKEALLEYLKTL